MLGFRIVGLVVVGFRAAWDVWMMVVVLWGWDVDFGGEVRMVVVSFGWLVVDDLGDGYNRL